MPARTRVIAGLVVGLAAGLALTALVVWTKAGFLVNTPRAAHPWLLIALFILPTLVTTLIALLWRPQK